MGNVEIKEEKDIFTIQSNKEVYFNCYGYTIDNPNVIINPYGNSPLTAIVMFETNDYSEVSITIKSKNGNSDINYTFSNDKYHLIPIYGLYPDYDNTVIIRSEGIEYILNIRTDKLPDDFLFDEENSDSNFEFYNVNYPYIIDSNNEVRWYLNSNYYGNITALSNSSFIIGSDRYDENNNSISFYKMNFLGKIYNEYLLFSSYYGSSALYNDNIVVLSDKILSIDLQTGEIIQEFIDNNNFDYLTVYDDNIIVSKDNNYYKVTTDGLEEFNYVEDINNYSFYSNTTNYKITPSSRFGMLMETNKSNKKISLFNYDNEIPNGLSIYKDVNRLIVINENEDNVYLILDKFLDKRIYEVNDIKYINFDGLSGNYTLYFKVGDNLYKTDYLLEV